LHRTTPVRSLRVSIRLIRAVAATPLRVAMGLTVLARPALALPRVVPGENNLTGVVVQHARIGKMGIAYNVNTIFECFVPVRGATPEVQAQLETLALAHADGQLVPDSAQWRVFAGSYDVKKNVLAIKEIRPPSDPRPTPAQVEQLLQEMRARALEMGSEADRQALDQLIKSGLMREFIHETVVFVNRIRPPGH
jgi:hypothetical protein